MPRSAPATTRAARLRATGLNLALLCLATASPARAAEPHTNATAAAAAAGPVAGTVLVAAQHQGQDLSTAAGVLVNPEGLVLTSQRAVAGATQVWVYLYSPDARTMKDARDFRRAHWRDALRATVQRTDAQLDLALLRLPHRDTPYPLIRFDDGGPVRAGQAVLALGPSPDALVWSGAQRGQVTEVRADAIMNEASASSCQPGAPLFSPEGLLLGLTVSLPGGPCIARPVSELRAFITGDASPVAPPDSLPHAEAMISAVARQLAAAQSKPVAVRALAELLVANALNGHAAARILTPTAGEALNAALAATARGEVFPHEDLIQLALQRLPLIVTGSDGIPYLRSGVKYARIAAATAGNAPLATAVDDITGTAYLIDDQGRLLNYDGQWRVAGLQKALDVVASNGVAYVLLANGKLLARRPGATREISRDPVSGALWASGGVLYLLNGKGELSRYHDDRWDARMAPIARDLRQVVASGATWFAINKAGQLVASEKGFTDLGEGAVTLWMGGPDLLMLTRHNNLFTYNSQRARWTSVPF